MSTRSFATLAVGLLALALVAAHFAMSPAVARQTSSRAASGSAATPPATPPPAAEDAMADACASTFECLDATGAGESEDQAALVAMLEQMFAGWTAGSGERIAGVFAEDGDFVSIDAVHARGRTAIAREHQRLLTSLYQGSSIAARVTSVRFVRPDVACVHAEAQVGSYGEPAPDPASAGFCPTFRLTVMATRRATGEWQFEALQQTRLAPASTGKPRFADRRYGGRRT